MATMWTELPFTPGDRVHIDGDENLVATVDTSGYDIRGPIVLLDWFHNGSYEMGWFAPCRLTLLPDGWEE